MMSDLWLSIAKASTPMPSGALSCNELFSVLSACRHGGSDVTLAAQDCEIVVTSQRRHGSFALTFMDGQIDPLPALLASIEPFGDASVNAGGGSGSPLGTVLCKDALGALAEMAKALHDRVLSTPEGDLPWIQGAGPRRAVAKLSNGYWLCLEDESEIDPPPLFRKGSQVFVFSAQSTEALLSEIEALVLAGPIDLERQARRLAQKPARGPYRLALIAKDKAELDVRSDLAKRLIRSADKPVFHPSGVFFSPWQEDLPVGFLFPGQGSQYPGMFLQSLLSVPELRGWFDQLDRQMPSGSLVRPSLLILKRTLESDQDASDFHGLSGGGLASLTVSLAVSDLLQKVGVRPQAMLGHSNGENAALLASGIIRTASRRGVISTLTQMTSLFEQADRGQKAKDVRAEGGACLALLLPTVLPDDQIQSLLGSDVHVMMENCPRQKVLWGTPSQLKRLKERVQDLGVVAQFVEINQPFHTRLFRPVADALVSGYALLDLGPPRVPLYSGWTGSRFPEARHDVIRTAVGQWSETVRFSDAITKMHEDGCRIFVDVGPAGRLAGFTRDTLGGLPHYAIAIDEQSRPDGLGPLRAISQLFVLGALNDVSAFFPAAQSGQTQASEGLVARAIKAGDAAAPKRGLRPLLPSSAGARSEILKSHMVLMREFLDRQCRIFEGTCRRLRSNVTSSKEPDSRPFSSPLERYGATRVLRTATTLQADLTLEPERHRFLRDHSFGRARFGRKSVGYGLPVLPLFLSAEISAAAAKEWVGGSAVVTSLENVAGLKWIAADTGKIRLFIRVSGTMMQDRRERSCHVEIHQANDSEVGSEKVFEADAVLDKSYPRPPDPLPATLPAPKDTTLDGTRSPTGAEFASRLFHGSSFQSIKSILGLSDRRIAVALEAPDSSKFQECGLSDALRVVPGALMDSAGQVFALHEKMRHNRIFGLFPYAVQSISFFRPVPASGEKLVAVTEQVATGSDMVGRVDYIGNDGLLALRISGLRLVFVDWTERWQKAFFPNQAPSTLGQTLLCDDDATVVLVEDFPQGFLESRHRIWLRTLAHCTLSIAERASFYKLPRIGSRSRDWLLGRIAVKEAAAVALSVEDSAIAELEVRPDPRGVPRVQGPERGDELPASIAHSGSFAVGAVTGRGKVVGIDLEPRRSSPERFLDRSLIFSEAEGEALASFGETVLWCAKEAVSKAIGTGLMGSPKRFQAGVEEGGGLVVTAGSTPFKVRLIPHDRVHIALVVADQVEAARAAQALTRAIPGPTEEELSVEHT